MKLLVELLLGIAFFVTVCFLSKNQPQISCNDGKGWDGVTYYSVTKQLMEGSTQISGDVPFVKRLGTPYLVSKYASYTGKDILSSDHDVNIAGSFLVMLLLIIWLRQFINKMWVRVSLVLLYLLAWHGILRYLFYYPLISDVWGLVFLMISLLLMQRIKDKWLATGKISFPLTIALSISIFIGIFFRESNEILALGALFIINPFSNFRPSSNYLKFETYGNFIGDSFKYYFRKDHILIFTPMIFAVFASYIISTHIININIAGYSYIKTMMQFFYEKSIPEVLLAIFIAYGPVLVLVPFFYKQYKTLLTTRQELTVLLLLALLFGYIGGTDTERILYMSSFPIVFILIGISIDAISQTKAKWWLAVIGLLQLIAYRVFWYIPDCATVTTHKPIPFFTLIGQDFEYLYLFSGFGNYGLNTILLIEYIGLLVLTGLIVNANKAAKI